MSDYPREVYGQWAGNNKGTQYKPDKCAKEVWGDWFSNQCSRKNGHGRDGLFCKQHKDTK